MLSRGRSFRIDQTILNGIKQRREQTFQPLFGEQGPVSFRLTPLPFLISSVHSNLPRSSLSDVNINARISPYRRRSPSAR